MNEARQEFNITDKQVAERAYTIFIGRGREHGRDVEDWLLAEAQLVEEATNKNLFIEDGDALLTDEVIIKAFVEEDVSEHGQG